MKNLRNSAILIPTLLVSLAACGSTTTSSGSTPDDTAADPSSTSVATAVESQSALTPEPEPAAPSPTNPPPPPPPATEPAADAPKINSFTVSASPICFPEVPDYEYATSLTATWDVSGATSIYIAVDNEFGPWEQDLAATGSTDVPAGSPCPSEDGFVDTQTYFLVAENASGRTVVQETRTPG